MAAKAPPVKFGLNCQPPAVPVENSIIPELGWIKILAIYTFTLRLAEIFLWLHYSFGGFLWGRVPYYIYSNYL